MPKLNTEHISQPLPEPHSCPPSGIAGGSHSSGEAELIRVTDASVAVASTLILDSIDLVIQRGESVALLGANGSGKSTLVKTMLGLMPLRAGSVRLFGHDVARRSSVPWEKIGYVPQRVGVSSGVPATALEVVRSGLLQPGRPWAGRGKAAREAAMAALDAVGLADRSQDHVQVFSGGQTQRVMIARALVRRPELLILDEPLAGIDRDSRQALAAILTRLRSEGMTLVTVLHEMGELADVVERAVVLAEGRVRSDGPAHDLTPFHHDHSEHDVVGHDVADDCEHAHPHGDLTPIPHHSPGLTGPLSAGFEHSVERA